MKHYERTCGTRGPFCRYQLGVHYGSVEECRCVLPQGRYAALMVSLHGTGLYRHYDTANDLPENAQAVQHYLERERAFQEELLASLRSDPHYRLYATEEVVARNQQLVGIWDALSLAICFGRNTPQSWEQVPTATSTTTLTLTGHDDDYPNFVYRRLRQVAKVELSLRDRPLRSSGPLSSAFRRADPFTFLQLCATALLSKLLSRCQTFQVPGERLPVSLIG